MRMICRVARYGGDNRGATAVEFAFIAPLFVMFLLGIICIGGVLATIHGVQQLAAEAARASLGGLTENERSDLARGYVTSHAQSYALIDPSKVVVDAQTSPTDPTTYEVIVRYDASQQFMFRFIGTIPLPASTFVRRAAIRRGGY